MRTAFAKALRTTRKAYGLTQEDFAMGSSRTYLSSLERGRQSPTLDKVAVLADIIGIHPLTLLTLSYVYLNEGRGIEELLARVRTEIGIPDLEVPMIRLFITDDHAIMRDGLRQLFALADDIEIVGEARSGDECLEKLAGLDVDVLLTDMTMPGLCGRDLIAALRERRPDLPILILSMHAEPQIVSEAMAAGANGYITKDQDAEMLIAAVRKVAGGQRYLDPRF